MEVKSIAECSEHSAILSICIKLAGQLSTGQDKLSAMSVFFIVSLGLMLNSQSLVVYLKIMSKKENENSYSN